MLHGSQTSALYRADNQNQGALHCQEKEIRPMMLKQMSSVSLAPILVCLLPWPISCFHSTKWLVNPHNPLCGEDKGTLWSNAPKHLIKSPLPLSSSLKSAGNPSCRHLLMWSCLKPSSVTPTWRLTGLDWVLYNNSLVLPLFCFGCWQWGQCLGKISQTGSGDDAGLGAVPHWVSNPSTPTASPLYFNGRRMISQHFKERKKAVESFLDSSLRWRKNQT